MTRIIAFCLLLGFAVDVSAQVLGQPDFDWTKYSGTTHVTGALAENQQDDVLTIGPGRITLTPSVTLSSAIVEADALKLRFTVDEGSQVLQFEYLQGATGRYQPAGWKARDITFSESPHTERFVRKGVLTLSIPRPEKSPRGRASTPNERLASLLPGPETGYKPRSEASAQLAAAISANYRMPGRDTNRSFGLQWQDAAAAAANHPSAELQRIAKIMLDQAKEESKIDPRAVRQSLVRKAEDLERQIASGQFTRREGSYDTGPLGGSIPVFQTVDNSAAARREASELRRVASLNDAEVKQWAIEQRHQNGFLDLFSGRDISNNPADQYQKLLHEATKILLAEARQHAGPPSNRHLIDIRRADSTMVKLRNVSNKTMTDVTMYISMGATRSDKAKRFSMPFLLFVPVWKPSEELELKFTLQLEPAVLHARADVYAKEASFLAMDPPREAFDFLLPDLKSPPDNRPGTMTLYLSHPVARDARVWIEIDGKRTDWEPGERQQYVMTADPGRYHVVIRSEVRGKQTTELDSTVTIDAGEKFFNRIRNQKAPDDAASRSPIEQAKAQQAPTPKPQNRQEAQELARRNAALEQRALQSLQLARGAIARKDDKWAVFYLNQTIKTAPDSRAAKTAELLLRKYEKAD